MGWKLFNFFASLPNRKAESIPPATSALPTMVLSGIATVRIPPTSEQIVLIRTALLGCLEEIQGPTSTQPHLWSRIAICTDLQALWYFRTDVLMYLAGYMGEPKARVRLQPITEMFRGLISKSQMGVRR